MSRTKKSPSEVKESPKKVDALGVNYTGKVTVKFVRNNKTIKTINRHNSGCRALFDFIVNCLCGEYNSGDVPMYLMGFKCENEQDVEEGVWTPSTTNPILVANVEPTYGISSQGSKTTYKFIIPSASIDSNSLPLNLFALYSTNNVGYSTGDKASTKAVAFISLGDKSITASDVAKGISIIVIWEMTVANQNTVNQ